jgi:hypothetical protein
MFCMGKCQRFPPTRKPKTELRVPRAYFAKFTLRWGGPFLFSYFGGGVKKTEKSRAPDFHARHNGIGLVRIGHPLYHTLEGVIALATNAIE